MSECFLCGQEEPAHHLGCVKALKPDITMDEAVELGLYPKAAREAVAQQTIAEVYHEGSMTPEVVVEDPEGDTAGTGEIEQCEFGDCENPKASNSPRAKYCAEHKDPKNRKE